MQKKREFNSIKVLNCIIHKKNDSKTIFFHISKKPDLTPMKIDENTFINAADTNKGCVYLGFHLKHTNNLKTLLEFNLQNKMYNIPKYYSWLETNKATPIRIKLQTLDSCLFSSLLYSIETWGDLSSIKEKLIKIELKLLKDILGVKQGTPNLLIHA